MDERTRQNLLDAGCPDELVRRFDEAGTTGERRRMLERYRRCLLDDIHVRQRRLDCLDYLLYQLRQEA